MLRTLSRLEDDTERCGPPPSGAPPPAETRTVVSLHVVALPFGRATSGLRTRCCYVGPQLPRAVYTATSRPAIRRITVVASPASRHRLVGLGGVLPICRRRRRRAANWNLRIPDGGLLAPAGGQDAFRFPGVPVAGRTSLMRR
jgi:hypothetical protein